MTSLALVELSSMPFSFVSFDRIVSHHGSAELIVSGIIIMAIGNGLGSSSGNLIGSFIIIAWNHTNYRFIFVAIKQYERLSYQDWANTVDKQIQRSVTVIHLIANSAILDEG